jgi:hypothetical protein
MSTEQTILSALAGHDAQKPMAFDDLVKKTGLEAAALKDVLQQMFKGVPASVNCAQVTKRGTTQMFYWPTGVVNVRTGPQGIVINPNHPSRQFLTQRREPAQEHARTPKVSANTTNRSKETEMNATERHTGASPLNQAIYDKITVHPGITHAPLVKAIQVKFPEVTEKQILKTISNMRHVTKKIRVEGERGNYAYHLNHGAVSGSPAQKGKQEAARKVPVGKVVTGAEAAALRNDASEPAHVVNDTKVAHSAPGKTDNLSIILDDKNNLCLSTESIDLELNPVQTERLQTFLRRVHLELPA